MIARTFTAAMQGLEATTVSVEVCFARGIQFHLSGLGDTAVKESKDRIVAALDNSGFKFPMVDVTVNMAPADIRKEGTGYDLPIAVAILVASDKVQCADLHRVMMIGELGLDGRLQPVRGILPIAIKARAEKFKALIVPKQNIREAAVVNNIDVYGMDSLADVVTFGVAPSAVLFYLFHEVHVPEFMMPLRPVLPYTAFLMAAFSALRLAKFNLDARQSTRFIGLPTPANALFWGSLVLGEHAFLVSLRFNAFFLFLFMLLFCFLLVAEVPLIALKFKSLSFAENKVRYLFLAGCIPCFLLGPSCFAAIIVWYVAVSLCAQGRFE